MYGDRLYCIEGHVQYMQDGGGWHVDDSSDTEIDSLMEGGREGLKWNENVVGSRTE